MNILKEHDLDKFKVFPGNRPIDKMNLQKIKSSIERNNLLQECPILINEKYEVLDGQHRLSAAKDLGLPIFYISKIGGGYEDVILMNENRRTWKNEDYLRLFAEGTKNLNYISLQNFMKVHNLKLSQALIIVNGPIKQMKEHSDFKEGKFIFPEDLEYLEDLVDKVKTFWGLCSEHGIKPLHRFKSTAFLKPFLIFITHPNVQWEIFFQKLESWWYKIGIRPSTNLYIDLFSDIYNYRNQNKIHIQ